MAVRDAIKLELPMGVKTFKFTFECRTPGHIDIEISVRKSLRSLGSPAGTMGGPDTSDVHTKTPGVLNNWLESQKADYRSFLLGAAKAGPPVVDDSVTEPESKPIAGNGMFTGPPADGSETELESEIQPSLKSPEPATPVEFT
ncbi:hypothetical protein BDR07DRAFT_1482200 [Suillus spraguei]|nr:hypothetical protein BDR07DRAFT_1482200 [Suillus spraguei]